MKKKKLEKEKIEDADEGIYKDIYSDNWYDSQQIRDISLPDEHIGWCLFDSYKRKHLYKYEIIHVFPIERTLINRFFWSIFRLGDRLSKSERVKRFINSKPIRIIGIFIGGIVELIRDIKDVIKEKNE